MLLGLPVTTGGARLDNPQQLRTQSYNAFINDSIRVTPNVFTTLGEVDAFSAGIEAAVRELA